MNLRINFDQTPEGRIAAVARSLCVQMAEKRKATGIGPSEPDYADFRDVLKPFIEREMINARIDEARKTGGLLLTLRVRQLADELAALKFPDGYSL